MPAATATTPLPAPKKPLVRRTGPDRSQEIRHLVQWLFVALNGLLGVQFYLWARFYERGGVGFAVPRPAGVDGWLPIAGMMNFKYFLSTGHVPVIHPAAMYLFIGFMLMSLLLKKSFCSWLCPVGTVSENLARIGRRIFKRNFRVWRWLDITLRALKYLLLGFFVYIVGTMSSEALAGFMSTPYGLIADVKMLDFFRTIGQTGAIVLAVLAMLSMLIQNFWCRYLCPYGALLGLTSLFSPVKIRRDEQACVDCGKCARACPASLPVDKLVQVRSVECTACMECVAACSAENALQLALPPRTADTPRMRWRRRALSPVVVTVALAYIFFGVILWARTTDHWQTHLPPEVYMRLVPTASQVGHPGM